MLTTMELSEKCLIPKSGKYIYFEIGHGILSRAILSLLLIYVGQLSVAGERMCTEYWLTA